MLLVKLHWYQHSESSMLKIFLKMLPIFYSFSLELCSIFHYLFGFNNFSLGRESNRLRGFPHPSLNSAWRWGISFCLKSFVVWFYFFFFPPSFFRIFQHQFGVTFGLELRKQYHSQDYSLIFTEMPVGAVSIDLWQFYLREQSRYINCEL